MKWIPQQKKTLRSKSRSSKKDNTIAPIQFNDKDYGILKDDEGRYQINWKPVAKMNTIKLVTIFFSITSNFTQFGRRRVESASCTVEPLFADFS